MGRDPVCGMTVDAARTPWRETVAGIPYVFCSAGCRDRFRQDPARYGAGSSAGTADAADGAAGESGAREGWTCPMHPEIVTAGPGSCPICGMALEPRTPAAAGAAAEENPELRDMRRRFVVTAALAVPLLAAGMAEAVPAGMRLLDAVPAATRNLVELLLATPAVVWGGWPFFQRGWASLVHRSLNMFTLIALGTGVAYGYSVAAALAPGLFPAAIRGPGGAVPVYFEAAAVITALVQLGQVLELRARGRTQAALRALLDLAPPVAHRLAPGGGSDSEVPLAEVRPTARKARSEAELSGTSSPSPR